MLAALQDNMRPPRPPQGPPASPRALSPRAPWPATHTAHSVTTPDGLTTNKFFLGPSLCLARWPLAAGG